MLDQTIFNFMFFIEIYGIKQKVLCPQYTRHRYLMNCLGQLESLDGLRNELKLINTTLSILLILDVYGFIQELKQPAKQSCQQLLHFTDKP